MEVIKRPTPSRVRKEEGLVDRITPVIGESTVVGGFRLIRTGKHTVTCERLREIQRFRESMGIASNHEQNRELGLPVLHIDFAIEAADETLLLGMIEQMNLATDLAEAALDDTLAFVDESNKRIFEMENARGYS